MKILKKLVSLIDNTIELIGKIFIWAIVPLTLFSVFEIIMRRFLGSPTIWSFEIITQIYGMYFMMVAAYGLLHHSHVSIDIITRKLPKKTQTILDLVGYFVFFFPFTIICFWKSYHYALYSWMVKETSWSSFAPPLYPIKTVIALTFLMLIIQGVSETIKKIMAIRGVSI